MNELLGSRIKALRIAKNLTQEQVADQIGVSRQKYARVESGTNSITLDILSKVAEIFDMLDLFYANKHMYNKLQNNNIR